MCQPSVLPAGKSGDPGGQGDGCSCVRIPTGEPCCDRNRWLSALRNDCNPDGNLTVKYSEVDRGSMASIGSSQLQGNSLIEMDLPSVRRLRRRGRNLFTKQGTRYSILVHVLCNKFSMFYAVIAECPYNNHKAMTRNGTSCRHKIHQVSCKVNITVDDVPYISHKPKL